MPFFRKNFLKLYNRLFQPGIKFSSVLPRRGDVGYWKKWFSEEDRNFFKENSNDLLIQLGYEKDNNW